MNNDKRKIEDSSRNSENYKINDENIDKPLEYISESEKKKKINKNKEKIVRSINNNIRSSVRKLNPILKGIVGKKS